MEHTAAVDIRSAFVDDKIRIRSVEATAPRRLSLPRVA
jgi:hypothetical protein